MATNIGKPKWFFYPGWVVLSVISIPIAWTVAWALMSQVEQVVGGTIQVGGQTHITEDFLFAYILFPVLGLLTGLLQYLWLRGYLPRMGWWILASLLGWLPFVAVLGLFSIFMVFPSTVSPAFAGVLLGGSIGVVPNGWCCVGACVARLYGF